MKDKKPKNKPRKMSNCPEPTAAEIEARAEEAVASYSSAEIETLQALPEPELRAWLFEFAKYMAAQNPDQPLPPKP